ncbi:4-oxalocrotonate tautomerase [Candidatus Termititenax persephonae]|uniref:4-oxalocrotonate tautomerase n=1 Tax=Candidatus Termititenax persephonae TaxID=2218525 RepID=A0A388TEV8_9BACT|nr:4-oxalocrotonate tautomerase [Candidatus Termititenax persephonae]
MPVVNIQWVKGRSKAQKQKIAAELEQLLIKEAGCRAGDTYVIFQDIAKEDFAVGGKLFG